MLHLRPNTPVEVKEKVAPETEGESKEVETEEEVPEEIPKSNKTEKKG